MDLKILDSWLRDYLVTTAKPVEIAKYLSLCGPSIERIEKFGKDFIYDIEVTTNRIDTASVYGIAREASTILPRFGIKASLKTIITPSKKYEFVKKVDYLKATVNPVLCPRFTVALIKDVKLGRSPDWMQMRLESAGVRSLNNVIDISNYIMLGLGQPVHTFDYDKIKGAKMVLRESKKGEKLVTLDEKEFTLPGGDIVMEDGEGRLIDLCGIMGGGLSAIDENTKNVLLFVQTYEPIHVRKTSMALAQRTVAATIFEKGADTEAVGPAILSAIELFENLTGGKIDKNILDIYPNPYKVQTVKTNYEFINERLGIVIPKKDITNYLTSLGFTCSWQGSELTVKVPSFRAKDVKIAEDVLEEIARIYGYHNLPSNVMVGNIPVRPTNPVFNFEMRIKNLLMGWGGVETYTLSLVSKEFVAEKSLKLKNPLGTETEYLRTTLRESLISVALGNTGNLDSFHIFEMANTYQPKVNDLPEERLMLAGIMYGYEYREGKGLVEALVEKLGIEVEFVGTEENGFSASKCAFIYSGKELIGKIGVTEKGNFVYYEFEVSKLFKLAPKVISYKEIPKYPAQIEDITFDLIERTKVGDIVQLVKQIKDISNVELGDIYNNSYTFRVWYQDKKKTLTDSEVEKVRREIISLVKSKFGATVKE